MAMNLKTNSVLLFSLFIIISLLANENLGVTHASNSDDRFVVYGCEKYTGVAHCGPIHNKLESYRIIGRSSVVYNVTDEPGFVQVKHGQALEVYSNHMKSITFSNTSTIAPKEFSVAFWIKPFSLPNRPSSPVIGTIVSQFDSKISGGWSFRSSNLQNSLNQTAYLTVYNTGNQGFSSPAVPISSKNFTHIVGTFDGEYIKVYKDGILLGKTKFNGTYSNNIEIPLTLGVSSGFPMLYYWTGNIDDLRYYDKVISADEIDRISHQNFIGKEDKTKMIGYWKFDDNLRDSSGNNRHGMERTLISSMIFTPDGRLFFSEKDTGKIKIMENETVNSKPFAVVEDYWSNWEQGLLGLAVDPDFESNHFIYLFYTSKDQDSKVPFNRIVRFTDVDNVASNETVLVDRLPASNGYHSGGAMVFGPDNKLYVTIGDATQNTKCGTLQSSLTDVCPAQDPYNLLGKVLRLNKDGSIPEDNPYPNSAVYNIGHTNMYGIAFDKTGFGLVSENGRALYDEINTIEKGSNYGAPTIQVLDINPELSSNSTKPLRSYYIAYCLTQMIYYNGNKVPELEGKFLVGSLSGYNPIFALGLNKTTNQIVTEEVIYLDNFPNNEVVAIAQSPNGEIYYGNYAINKLVSVDATGKSQLLYPVEIIYSTTGSNITNLSFIQSNKELRIDLDAVSETNNPTLQITIPQQFLDKIYTVASTGDKKNIDQKITNFDFSIQSIPHTNSTVVNIILEKEGHYRFSILGNSSSF
jgi:glucose/arabinose dehydrogenase